MTPEETKYIDQRFDSLVTLVNAQFQTVNFRLDQINGKVGRHSEQIEEINMGRQRTRDWLETREKTCPQEKRINELETKNKVNMSLKSFVIGSITLFAVVIGSVYSTIKIVESHQAKKAQIVNTQTVTEENKK